MKATDSGQGRASAATAVRISSRVAILGAMLLATALASLSQCGAARAASAGAMSLDSDGLVSPLTGGTKVSGVSASANVYSAGATQVLYTVKFKAEHALAEPSGYVRLTAPAGAEFYSANSYSYEVSNGSKSAQSNEVKTSPEGLGENVVDVYIPGFSIAAGETVTIAAYGSKNPTSEDPSGKFSVSTSADTEAVSVPFAIGPASAISDLNLNADTTSAGASSVLYTASFKSTSAISSGDGSQFGDDEQPGYIRLTAPAGTVFNTNGDSYEVSDEHESWQAQGVTVNPDGLGENIVDVEVSPYFPVGVAAGETVKVEAYGATNPSAPVPGGEASVSTSSDIQAVSKPLAIEAKTSISELTASANVTAAEATSVLYTASFKATTAISSGDAAQFGDNEQPGFIRLVAPAGTVFNSDDYSYEVSDEHESQQALHVTVDPENTDATNVVDIDVSPRFPVGVAAGETVKVEAYGAKNPEFEVPAGQLSVSTSSDVQPVAMALPIGPASSVQDASLGEHDGAYTVQFASPSNISNGDPEQFGDDEQPGFVTVAASAGTTLPGEGRDYGFSVRTVDGTTEYGVLHVEVHGQTATIETAETIPGGSQVKLTIEGVTGTGLTSALISTSSDAVPVNAGAIELAPLSGTVTFEGAAVADATVQACPIAGGTCQTTSTNGSGGFTFAVPATTGSYALTANPPAASSHAGEGKLSPATIKGAAGATGIELALPTAPKIAPHVKIVTSGGGEQSSATGYPFVSWASPYELSLEPELFPKASRILVTKVVVRGSNVASGEPEQQIVDVGGSVGGLPTGLALGSGPLTVDMPSDYPMHGEVSTTVDYRIERGHRAAAGGVASTNVLDETYPASGSPATDPLAAYFLNYGKPAGISLGTARIVGPDARYFKVVPLGSIGAPHTSTDCGASAVELSQFDGSGSPPASTECGIAVQFTPPAEGQARRIYYHAKLRVATGVSGASTIPVALLGCDARVAQATGSTCYRSAGAGVSEEAHEETPTDPGRLLAQLGEEVARLQKKEKECLVYVGGNMVPTGEPEPCLGEAQSESSGGSVEIEEEEEEGEEEAEGGSSYHDPSGVVYAQTGEGPVPLSGATVTLKQSFDAAGPFAVVPNESAVMSPANRTNPGSTDADGMFGWDVLAGYYTIEASKSGCDSQITPVLEVPPPVSNLELMLTCLSPPTRSATSANVSSSSPTSTYGEAVTFTAQVGGGTSPTGTVTFDDGGTPIGEGVLEHGEATLTLGTLAPGAHSIAVSYSGDGANRPEVSPAIAQTVVSSGEEGTVELPIEPVQGGGGSTTTSTTPAGQAAAKSSPGRVALLATKLGVSGADRAAVKLSCTGDSACTGTLALTVEEKVKRGKRKLTKRETIATAPFSIAAGKSETIELKLDPAGGALLRKARGQLRANLTLSAPSASPPGATTAGVLLVRQKPKSKRH